MASISRDPSGNRTIQFVGADGKRRSIRLGKLNKRQAEEIKIKVEALAASKKANLPLLNETAGWVAGIGDDLHSRLVAVGLLEGRQKKESPTLDRFITDFIAEHHAAKKMSRVNLRVAGDRLIRFFGDIHLTEVTPGSADQFVTWLRGIYAQATVSRSIKYAKQFFQAAVRRRLIPENPFQDIKAGHQTNEKRKCFVTRETTGKVLAACPDAEWRLIVALARYGGLRCPSEHLELKWTDILWDPGRFRVTSPKTEHHEGQGERWVPIFPDLLPYLQEAFEQAPEGAIHVINRTRNSQVNWRTTFLKIVRRAGVSAWEKPFVNMRASRETELAAVFPLHVVTAWLGNSPTVATKHYLQVTDQDFQRALAGGAESGAVVVQKPVQQPSASRCEASQNVTEDVALCDVTPEVATICDIKEYARQDSNPRPSV